MKKILYLLIVAYGVVFLILYNNYGVFVAFVTLALLPAYLKAVSLCLKRKTKLRVRVPRPFVEQGEEVEVLVRIANESRILPISHGVAYLEFQNRISGDKGGRKMAFHVNAGGEVVVTAKWEADHCGRMAVRIRSVRIYDYFGVFYTKMRMNKKRRHAKTWEKDVMVMPGYLEMLPPPDAAYRETEGESNLYSKHKKGEDPSEVFSIREYKDGDKLHRIHWNLSYKKDQYMVKEYGLALVCAVTLVMDFSLSGKGRGNFEYVDALLKLAFSLSFAYVQQSLLHYLVWYDKEAEEPVRRLIGSEDEVYEAFQELLSANALEGGEALREGYCKAYGGERQQLLYYLSTKKPKGEEDDWLEWMACKRLEWIRVVKGERKREKAEGSVLTALRFHEFGIGRLEEDVREWLLSE